MAGVTVARTWSDHHALAQDLSSRAAVLAATGDTVGARALFLDAARHEEQAVLGCPGDRPKTMWILAESFAAMQYKAGALDPEADDLDDTGPA